MRSKRALHSVVTTLTLGVLLASAALATAQETAEAAEPAAQVFQGVGTLFLLIGLGAVGLVSLVWLARERSARNGDETP